VHLQSDKGRLDRTGGDHVVLIRSGWLIDGSGETVRENAGILIENGTIRKILNDPPENDSFRRVVDWTAYTMLPGLVDGHVHLFMGGDTRREIRDRQLAAGYDAACATISRNLENHLRYGVVAVRDGGDRNGFALRYKKEEMREESLPVHIRAAGWAWRQKGRYGRMIGRVPEDGQTLARAIRIVGAGCDHVKIVNSGLNSLLYFGKQTRPQFTSEELTAAVDISRRLGLKVMVHANGEVPVKMAVEVGCDSIEHGYFMGRDNLMRMADRQIAWLPTLCPIKAHAEEMASGDPGFDVCRRTLDHQFDQLRMAREYGVRVILGTDSGSVGVHHGRAVWEEIGLLVKGGYPIESAFRCACQEGAALLGFVGKGIISIGEPATFIAAEGPPDRLLENVQPMKKVCINGGLIKTLETTSDGRGQR